MLNTSIVDDTDAISARMRELEARPTKVGGGHQELTPAYLDIVKQLLTTLRVKCSHHLLATWEPALTVRSAVAYNCEAGEHFTLKWREEPELMCGIDGTLVWI